MWLYLGQLGLVAPTRSVAVGWGLAVNGNLGDGQPAGSDQTLYGDVTGLTNVVQVAAGASTAWP